MQQYQLNKTELFSLIYETSAQFILLTSTEDNLHILLDSIYLYINPVYVLNRSCGPEGLSD